MEKYCVDLEIAKELEENGFPQSTCFGYAYCSLSDTLIFEKYNNIVASEKFSAPTSDELLEELPKTMEINNAFYYLNIFQDVYSPNARLIRTFYLVSYSDHSGRCFDAPNNLCIEDDKLSNALALIWLMLKKKGYIK